MMSNYHVFGSPQSGDVYVVQPSLLDGGTPEDVIGRVYHGIPLKFGEAEENKVDVSIAEIERCIHEHTWDWRRNGGWKPIIE